MNFLKSIVKLNNRLEASWQLLDLSAESVMVVKGWYVAEFMVSGHFDSTPRLVLLDSQGEQHERFLRGAHSGHNRILIYLPQGKLLGHSDCLQFERVARVSGLESRARILLICFRYLLDFFSLRVLASMVLMQFLPAIKLSDRLLHFYSPDLSDGGYLRNVNKWYRYRKFAKQLAWFAGSVKIAVVIQDETQRAELNEMLLPPDLIISAEQSVPTDIDYVIALRRDEHLLWPAILMLKRALKHHKKVPPRLIYTDHDFVEPDDERVPRRAPVFKPQPSQCYLHCFNYIAPALVFARETVSELDVGLLFEEQQRYLTSLHCFKQIDRVLHLPEVLFRCDQTHTVTTPSPTSRQSPWQNIEWQRRQDYNVLHASEEADRGPSIDLIIPTRDGLSVLKPCVDSIISKTRYQDYHIIIVDNGSENAETLAYFDCLREQENVKIVEYPGEFNYSAINNFAITQGCSPYVALINNDIEVIEGDWLSQMMAWAVQPDVGVVGAKLLFSNGRVQHAGVTIGMGNAAGHIHRLEEGDAPGYQLRCLATQNMMAVTAACLITPRALFDQIGRLDESHLKVAYNDIDYCLRVESTGRQIIWTPQAVLFHHESVSRGDDMSDPHIERYFAELEVFQQRWKTKGFVDKYYNRHLRISDEGVFPQVERKQQDELVYFRV